MNSKNIKVLRKILYAVETGGQVYGQQRYNDFTPAYKNTSTENSITIGAGAWFRNEGRNLLKKILQNYPAVFRKYDSANIEGDLSRDWTNYTPSASSAKAKAIVSIISSPEGVKCQDELMEEQIKTYTAEIINKYGDMPDTAVMECINIRHQGGDGAVKRILGKTKKPYTVDSIYAALCTDPDDKSNNNQVGDYTGRQKKVYEYIKKYADNASGGDTMAVTKEQAIAKMIEIATAEIGYLEKASNSQLDSKTANAGYGNYTKYWRDIAPSYQGQPYCAGFVSWVLMKAFGIETAKKLLKHWPYIYCPTLGNLFTRYANPEVGDIVIFWRGGTFAHTGIVIRVEGDRFWTIEGNTSGGSTIVANGGGVCQKSYYNSQLPGTKFCRLDWSLVTSINDSNSVPNLPTTAYNTPWVGKCTADDVNVRTGAGTTYPNASYPKLNKDNRMDVLGETGEWYYVNIQGNKGYISKKYVEKVESSSSGNTTTPSKANKVIKNGQVHANNFAATGIVTDGIRGAATIKAAKKVLQQGLNLDYRAGLEIDGEIGILTHKALGNHYVEYGEKQYMVTALEILLMLKGYEVNGVESPGTYGSGLKSAVKKWAADNGISVNSNGRVSANMFLKLVQ